MRDKHGISTEVRVKENCLSFVHRLEFASEDQRSIFLPVVINNVIKKQKLNAEWKKKKYVIR